MIRETLESQAGESIRREFFAAALGDDRRRDRLCEMGELLTQNPSGSFPRVFAEEAELEAAYRFLSNPQVSWEEILRPHVQKTFERLAEAESPLILHDTTQFCFGEGEHIVGLGYLAGKKKGFIGHISLAVDFSQGLMLPLGVANAHIYRRLGKKKGKRSHKELRDDKTKESLRWWDSVESVRHQTTKKPIHVMDREADIYWLLSQLINNEERFVVRVCKDRGVEGSEALLYAQMDRAAFVCEREVYLSARKEETAPRLRKSHPARTCRKAMLGFSARPVVIKRGRQAGAKWPKSLTVNVVLVKEISPPEGQEPVQWRLITLEPIESEEDILRIVDIYRCRWLIEEFFKALKTGCAYEKRQLESYDSLVNALAIFMPIAWRILLLRGLQRQTSSKAASVMLTSEQIVILRAISKRPPPENPTISDVITAIARLGGHIKNNGAPGWQVLWRGYKTFIAAERGWKAAMQCANVINR